MNINDLGEGVSLSIQGRIKVCRLAENDLDLETLFEGEDGFCNLPDGLENAEICHMFAEPDSKGDAVLVIEVERKDEEPASSCLCPGCGYELSETGVIELTGFYCTPDEEGGLSYEATRKQLDDTEGYKCARCDADLDWTEMEGYTQIMPYRKGGKA
ncbi:MAG: hypothetical protein RSG23_08710 [Gordonibacter sp.]|uniref:hypothetical protein n=1 Tax=Gordonibacter sp. TaxID=1968902 RepID=UPI002FCBA55E